jgi:biopolymer transport protein ExbB
MQGITTPTGPEELTLMGLLAKGGPIMIPIVLLSIISIYLFVERWLYISSVSKTSPGFIESLVDHLQNGNVNAAKSAAQREPNVIGRMIFPALSFIGQPFREIESVMEASAEIQIGKMERNLGYLGVIAGVAPMLGFIGTISGVIRIFYNIAASDDISMGIIAGGLYEKMITSGAGLIVGMIAFICYHILNLRVQRTTLRLQEESISFLSQINRSGK